MASIGSPKVVLMGKGNNSEVYELIKEIKTSKIPSNLLYCVFVTLNKGDRYKVSKSMFGKEIKYDNIESQLSSLNFEGEIDLVEIVIDLDKTQSELEERTSEFLKPYFT